MVSYWTQFAANGDPNSPATPSWPAYTSANDTYQSLEPPTPNPTTGFAADHNARSGMRTSDVTTQPAAEAVASPRTIAGLADFGGRAPRRPAALRFKQGDDWVDRSYRELADDARALAFGLIDVGVSAGDRVCILANTRAEWTTLELAIAMAGAVVVPIYPTNSPEECEWVAGNSGAVAVVGENADQLAKVRAVRERLPDLKTLIVIDGEDGDAITLDELREPWRRRRRARPAGSRAVKPDDPLMFIYTSGTTGPPKGCVLSHGNFRALCDMVDELGRDRRGRRRLSLPAARPCLRAADPDRACSTSAARSPTTAATRGRSSRRSRELHPDYVPSVPRIFEKIYGLATAQLAQATPEQREQFRQAVKLGVRVRSMEARGEPVPEELRAPLRAGRRADLQAACARSSAAACARRRPARRRSRPRSSSSSTRPAARCWRVTG